MTRTELELNAYVHHLEEHLQLTVFGRGVADPEAAVLLVRARWPRVTGPGWRNWPRPPPG